MDKIKNEISEAFDVLSTLLVDGDNVERVAIAKSHLKTAYRLLLDLGQQAESEGTDG